MSYKSAPAFSRDNTTTMMRAGGLWLSQGQALMVAKNYYSFAYILPLNLSQLDLSFNKSTAKSLQIVVIG